VLSQFNLATESFRTLNVFAETPMKFLFMKFKNPDV
jgi:hypothetical protein